MAHWQPPGYDFITYSRGKIIEGDNGNNDVSKSAIKHLVKWFSLLSRNFVAKFSYLQLPPWQFRNLWTVLFFSVKLFTWILFLKRTFRNFFIGKAEIAARDCQNFKLLSAD